MDITCNGADDGSIEVSSTNDRATLAGNFHLYVGNGSSFKISPLPVRRLPAQNFPPNTP